MTIYVAPEDELTIGQVVADLRNHLGKSQVEVLNLLAGLVEDSEFGKNKIQVYTKHSKPMRSWSTQKGMEVDAVLKRKPRISPAVLSARLREAGRDGLQAARTVPAGEDSVPVSIDQVFIGRLELIDALTAKHWAIPPCWLGQANTDSTRAEPPLTRPAIVKKYNELSPEKWRNLFERDVALKECRTGDKLGKHILYSKAKIEQWLIAKGIYDDAQLARSAKSVAKKRDSAMTASNLLQSFPKRTHFLK